MADSLRFPGVVSAGGSVSSVALPGHVGAVSRRLDLPGGPPAPGRPVYIGVLVKPEGRLLAGADGGGFEVHLSWHWAELRRLPARGGGRRGASTFDSLGFGKPWGPGGGTRWTGTPARATGA